MNIAFPKDILIIDFESTLGDNSEKNKPAQFAAILLDKNSLKEKESFTSFIKTDLSTIPPQRLSAKGFTSENFDNAPSAHEVVNKFIKLFGKDYFISSWVANLDIKLFEKLISSANISFSEFDYHIYDIWPVAYTYLLQHGYTGSFRSEDIFQYFGLQKRGKHDALEDCRYAADVLRKIMK